MSWWSGRKRAGEAEEQRAELESYLALAEEENIARGMTREEASRAARRKLGNEARIHEEIYEMHALSTVGRVVADARFAARQLAHGPGFLVAAVGSLALGIGANTAIFQLLDAIRLQTLPAVQPNQLAEIHIAGGNQGFGTNEGWNRLTYPLWRQIRENQRSFSSVFAWGVGEMQFRIGQPAGLSESPRRAKMAWASGEAFRTLGLQPRLGRLIEPADEEQGCLAAPIVISHGFWQREFGGAATALGARVYLDGRAATVVGVAPAEFYGLDAGAQVDLVLPACAVNLWRPGTTELRNAFWLGAMGRLKPGVTAGTAAGQLRQQSAAWFQAVAPTGYDTTSLERWRKFRLTAEVNSGGMNSLRRQYEGSVWMLLATSGLVLAITWANLANLMLARYRAAGREIAIRLALGASRGRVVGQLMTESLLLTVMGAAAGVALAPLCSQALVRFMETRTAAIELDLGINWRVLLFTLGIAVAGSLAFGLSSAWYATRRSGGESGMPAARAVTQDQQRFTFQRVMIAIQVAVSLLLLVFAGLFVRSFRTLITADAGFRQEDISFVALNFAGMGLGDAANFGMKRQLLERVRAIPGVEQASTTTRIPLNGTGWSLLVESSDGRRNNSRFTWVSPNYFRTMGIGTVAGRDVEWSDTGTSRRVLVVNETFATKFLGGGNPLGRTVRSLAEPGFAETVYEIAGVVKDTKYSDLREGAQPIAYAPDAQWPGAGPFTNVALRTRLSEGALQAAVREAVAEVSPQVRVTAIVPLRQTALDRLARERVLAWLGAVFGGLATVLVALGLYGSISYMTASRRNEIGIRLALGSTRAKVVMLVVRQLGMAVAAGLLAGGVSSGIAEGALSSLLFGLDPHDTATYAGATAFLTAVALGAAILPALRAALVDPASVMRQE